MLPTSPPADLRQQAVTDNTVAFDTALTSIQRLETTYKKGEYPAVGDSWSFHAGMANTGETRITLLSKPTPHHPTRSCRLEVTVPLSVTALPVSLLFSSSSDSGGGMGGGGARVALCDFIARRFQVVIAESSTARLHGIRSQPVGSFCLETNWVRVCAEADGGCTIRAILEIRGTAQGSRGGRINRESGTEADGNGHRNSLEVGVAESVVTLVTRALLSRDRPGGGFDADAARSHIQSVRDQRRLRELVASSDGIAFVANGAILPRKSGTDDAPMEVSQGAVLFESPPSLRRDFELPHRGIISGMLVPRGVTIIVGGGYHGKSTLLRALAVGVYDKVPGDGREFVVTNPGAVAIRAEDGRPVSGVDISPFISALPCPKPTATPTTPPVTRNGSDVDGAHIAGSLAISEGNKQGNSVAPVESGPDPENKSQDGASGSIAKERNSTTWFSSGAASGSTSQAANVMEALEAGASALLLDEDTCAGNFMIRDSRMRAMVSHEPITPFIYRVSSLWLELDISSIIVVGGCGDYFDVHDTAILVDSYVATNATERAHSISRRYCVGRVQYAGRGLVHRLPWPGNPKPRTIVPQSILPPGKTSEKKRNRETTENEGGKSTCRPRRGSAGLEGDLSKAEATTPAVVALSNGGNSTEGGTGNGQHHPAEKGAENGYLQEQDAITSSKSTECSCTCSCGAATGAAGLGNSSSKLARVANSWADVARVEQIVGGAAQTRGCALGVEWILRATERLPGLTVTAALDAFEAAMEENEGSGLGALLLPFNAEGQGLGDSFDHSFDFVAKPRRFEVAALLNRLREVRFEHVAHDLMPPEVGGSGGEA